MVASLRWSTSKAVLTTASGGSTPVVSTRNMNLSCPRPTVNNNHARNEREYGYTYPQMRTACRIQRCAVVSGNRSTSLLSPRGPSLPA